MALLMEIRLQENEKRNVSSDYHVQYAANHLEKAKDVFRILYYLNQNILNYRKESEKIWQSIRRLISGQIRMEQ